MYYYRNLTPEQRNEVVAYPATATSPLAFAAALEF